MSVVGIYAFLGVAAVLFLAMIGSGSHPQSASPPKASLLDDQEFNAKSPGFNEGVRKLIALRGFECPALSQLWVKGDSPFGPSLEALCGPADGSRNAITNLHYMVYPKRLKVELCKPFGPMGGGCDDG
jgi:hypothetical protein